MHPIVFNETNGNIRLDGNVNDISVNPLTNTIYVSKVSSDKIDVINGSNNQIISNITVENQPNQIAVNPLTNTIYVSKDSSDKIDVINGSNNQIISNIGVDPIPIDIAIDPNTTRIYVASFGDNSTISTINGSNNKVIDKVSIARPTGIDIDPANGILFVKHYDYSGMSALSTTTNKIVEDARSKRDIEFLTEPGSGGNIYCGWDEGSYDSYYSPSNRFRLDNDTEITCNAYYTRTGYLFQNWRSNGDTLSNSTELTLSLTNQTMIVAYFNQLIPSGILETIVILGGTAIIIHLTHSRLISRREKRRVEKNDRRDPRQEGKFGAVGNY